VKELSDILHVELCVQLFGFTMCLYVVVAVADPLVPSLPFNKCCNKLVSHWLI